MAEPPSGMTRESFVQAVDEVILARKTRKILDGPTSGEHSDTPFDELVRQAVAVAGWAPFHFPRSNEVPEPWRFYVLNKQAIATLGEKIHDKIAQTKLPAIFAGAGALVQVTWIPEGVPDKDWEHAAAAAAAAQNLLLAAEARGLGTYWSSAKFLAAESVFDFCGIGSEEKLIGSIFIGKPLPAEREENEGIAGKQRPQRTSPDAWCRWVTE